MKLKTLALTSAIMAFTGIVYAQNAASIASAASAVPMAVVLSAGVANNSNINDASGLVLSVPVALSISGTELIVDTVTSTAKGLKYGLLRASDGAAVTVEVLGQTAGKVSLTVGAAVTVTAISGGILLSAAGEALAFIPNKVGQSLMHNRVLK